MAITAYPNILPVSAGSAHTKGSYIQIVASTPYASSRLYLIAEFIFPTTGQLALFDLATGAAGSETVIVSNIALDSNSDAITGVVLPVDVDIPAGTRLAARLQTTAATQTLTLHVYLENRAIASLANPTTYGADTATSKGTLIDPGATPGTKSAYVQFSASTTSRHDALAICLTVSAAGTVIGTGSRWALDIATGGAGAETIVLPDITVAANTLADGVRPGLVRFPVSIPAGTRLSARCQCNVNTPTLRVLAVTLIGMQEPATSSGGGASAVAYLG